MQTDFSFQQKNYRHELKVFISSDNSMNVTGTSCCVSGVCIHQSCDNRKACFFQQEKWNIAPLPPAVYDQHLHASAAL